MKVDQNNTTSTDTLPIPPPHPSNIPNEEHFPSGSSVCQMIGAGRTLPDEIVLNMKVVQNGSTNTDTLSTCLSDASNTADMEPSPSGSLVP